MDPFLPIHIGRRLIFTRQMDLLITSEAGVEAVPQNFLQGNYSLDAAGEAHLMAKGASPTPMEVGEGEISAHIQAVFLISP